MRSASLVVVGLVAVASCDSAVTLSIASDRPVPSAIDAICVGLADVDLAGGQFGQHYRLEAELATLPQTLRVESGGAEMAWAWVRGDRGGVPVATAATPVDFGDDVTLGLARCVRGPATSPTPQGDPVGPPNARLVASQGQGGSVVVAVGDAELVVLDARGGRVVAGDPLAIDPPVAAIAVDVDGDCDDDLVVATTTNQLVVLRRDGIAFAELATLAVAPTAALAAADVDRDGDSDLVLGGGADLTLYLNDGAGSFTLAMAPIPTAGALTAVAALATGDLDGDGNPDLVVGQAGGPLRAWVGGAGSFTYAPGAVPAVPLDVVGLALVDADGDFDPDLAVAVRAAPLRLYIDRDGRLEDQSFVRLPQPAPIAAAIAIGGWDGGCEPDAIVVGTAGAVWRGRPGGAFEVEAAAAEATAVVLVDLDDDGDLDALTAGAQGVTWLAR